MSGVEDDDRHQIMQTLFGDQSEEEEEQEEVQSQHESNQKQDLEDDDEVEPEGEGEAEVDGPEAAEVESEGELHDVDPDAVESDAEQDQNSQEVVVAERREDSDGKESESDEKDGYGEIAATHRRRDVIESGSERSEENHYVDNDEEVGQTRSLSRSPEEEKDEVLISSSAPEIRDVFGDSDEEEPLEFTVHDNTEEDFNRTNLEDEEDFDRDLKPEDMIADEEAQYESDEGHFEARIKEKPVGPPLELEIPFRPPPASPDKMNMVKVSNIMGIAPKPFNPKTFAEEEVFETDESGSKKRIRLDDNIVRWRIVRKPDGTQSYESNARFVKWSDGSLQLLIGNEVLDISVQDAQHDQAHLFLRHGKGVLQSQGRVLSKMKFMPSSLSSKSHRLLTALVDSQHKKVYKVKNCFTHIDPEREKEQKEKVLDQTIKANELLNRKKEKVHRKYTQTVRRERQLSPGFLEEALEEPGEEEDADHYESRRSGSRRRFDEDIEIEARAEKRLANAKKGQREIPRKSTFTPTKSSRRPVEFSESEREESEYETEEEEEENSPQRRRVEKQEDEDEDLGEEEVDANEESEEEEEPEEPKQKGRESGGSLKRRGIESDEESPPRKSATHRRMAIVYDSDDE